MSLFKSGVNFGHKPIGVMTLFELCICFNDESITYLSQDYTTIMRLIDSCGHLVHGPITVMNLFTLCTYLSHKPI